MEKFKGRSNFIMPIRLFFYINEILREYIKNLNKEDRYKNFTKFRFGEVFVLFNTLVQNSFNLY
jgi:hypothetical protein